MKFKTNYKYWENQSLAKPNGKKENAKYIFKSFQNDTQSDR